MQQGDAPAETVGQVTTDEKDRRSNDGGPDVNHQQDGTMNEDPQQDDADSETDSDTFEWEDVELHGQDAQQADTSSHFSSSSDEEDADDADGATPCEHGDDELQVENQDAEVVSETADETTQHHDASSVPQSEGDNGAVTQDDDDWLGTSQQEETEDHSRGTVPLRAVFFDFGLEEPAFNRVKPRSVRTQSTFSPEPGQLTFTVGPSKLRQVSLESSQEELDVVEDEAAETANSESKASSFPASSAPIPTSPSLYRPKGDSWADFDDEDDATYWAEERRRSESTVDRQESEQGESNESLVTDDEEQVDVEAEFRQYQASSADISEDEADDVPQVRPFTRSNDVDPSERPSSRRGPLETDSPAGSDSTLSFQPSNSGDGEASREAADLPTPLDGTDDSTPVAPQPQGKKKQDEEHKSDSLTPQQRLARARGILKIRDQGVSKVDQIPEGAEDTKSLREAIDQLEAMDELGVTARRYRDERDAVTDRLRTKWQEYNDLIDQYNEIVKEFEDLRECYESAKEASRRCQEDCEKADNETKVFANNAKEERELADCELWGPAVDTRECVSPSILTSSFLTDMTNNNCSAETNTELQFASTAGTTPQLHIKGTSDASVQANLGYSQFHVNGTSDAGVQVNLGHFTEDMRLTLAGSAATREENQTNLARVQFRNSMKMLKWSRMQNRELQNKLEMCQAHGGRLSKAKDDLEVTLKELSEQSTSWEDGSSDCKPMIDQGEVDFLNAELSQARERVQNLQQEVEEQRQECKRLEEEYGQPDEKRQMLATEVQMRSTELAEMQKSHKTLSEALGVAESEKTELSDENKRLKTLLNQIREWQEREREAAARIVTTPRTPHQPQTPTPALATTERTISRDLLTPLPTGGFDAPRTAFTPAETARPEKWVLREATLRNSQAYQQTRERLDQQRQAEQKKEAEFHLLQEDALKALCGWEEIPYVSEEKRVSSWKTILVAQS